MGYVVLLLILDVGTFDREGCVIRFGVVQLR